MAGVNDGNYWVPEEGSSGLYAGQDVRVLEYMTGRPHYSTKNIEESIEQIKTSPYSAISSSSVYHDRVGGHAQYVVDIEPVTLKMVKLKMFYLMTIPGARVKMKMSGLTPMAC